mmetsp:Transcript_7930/g.11953  ORF Transcript_7930/g.11953 Transcript_7930/m.11953 type:complete len:372 (+) Transcript_7930:34-1149(+)
MGTKQSRRQKSASNSVSRISVSQEALEEDRTSHEVSRKRVIEIRAKIEENEQDEKDMPEMKDLHPLLRKLHFMPEMGPLISKDVFDRQSRTTRTLMDPNLASMKYSSIHQLSGNLWVSFAKRKYDSLVTQKDLLLAVDKVDVASKAKMNRASTLHLNITKLASELHQIRKMTISLNRSCVALSRALVGAESLRNLLPVDRRPPSFDISWGPWLPTTEDGRRTIKSILLKEGNLSKLVSFEHNQTLPSVDERYHFRHFRLFWLENKKILLALFLAKDVRRPRAKIFVESKNEVEIIEYKNTKREGKENEVSSNLVDSMSPPVIKIIKITKGTVSTWIRTPNRKDLEDLAKCIHMALDLKSEEGARGLAKAQQ